MTLRYRLNFFFPLFGSYSSYPRNPSAPLHNLKSLYTSKLMCHIADMSKPFSSINLRTYSHPSGSLSPRTSVQVVTWLSFKNYGTKPSAFICHLFLAELRFTDQTFPLFEILSLPKFTKINKVNVLGRNLTLRLMQHCR